MKIGQRNCLLLKEIVDNHATITGKALEAKLHLSRKQLEYGIAKLNEYLKEQQLPTLERSSSGRILVPGAVLTQLDLRQLEHENTDIWLSREERRDIIEFMLLTKRQELSLQHFIAELKASKNTVLADLKGLKRTLAQEGIALTYSREHGYLLKGAEYTLRQRLFSVLRHILSSYGQRVLAVRIGQISAKELERMRRVTEEIEQELNTQFTDEMMEVNNFFFFLLLQRIQDGMALSEAPDALRHVAGTKEYMVVQARLAAEGVHNVCETVYLTAHIQSMKINSRLDSVAGQEEAGRAVEETIGNFERLACVQLRDRAYTFRLLMNHSIPALYRIRYNFHVGPDISEYVLPTYQEIHDIVKKSVGPLEALAGMPFPEEELVYITLIFAAQVRAEEEAPERRLSAVVVCQNGVSVSHFLLTSLKRTFPEIDFLTYLSVRQFYQYREEFDLVFTAVPLRTDKKQFVIEPLMDRAERKKLRRNVLEGLNDTGHIFPQAETILQIIRKHTNESVFKKLRMEIDLYMEQAGREAPERGDTRKPTLRELLTGSNVRVIQTDMGWEEAIEFAAIPLLYKKVIEYRYIEAMLSSITRHRPMLLIADRVIIAHAGVDAGVNDVGMSMLVLPRPITVHGYMEAQIIFVLAAPDYERHLTALNQLIDLLEDEEKLAVIRGARSPAEILPLLP